MLSLMPVVTPPPFPPPHFPTSPKKRFGIFSLDILNVLLKKTKQTLARDATLTTFEDVIMDVFKVSSWVKRRPSTYGNPHKFRVTLT